MNSNNPTKKGFQPPDTRAKYMPTEEQIAKAAAKIKARNLAHLKSEPEVEVADELPLRRRLR